MKLAKPPVMNLQDIHKKNENRHKLLGSQSYRPTVFTITALISVCVSMAALHQHLADKLLQWGCLGGKRSAL